MESVNRGNGRLELHMRRARVELIGQQPQEFDDVRVYDHWVIIGNRIITRDRVLEVEEVERG